MNSAVSIFASAMSPVGAYESCAHVTKSKATTDSVRSSHLLKLGHRLIQELLYQPAYAVSTRESVSILIHPIMLSSPASTRITVLLRHSHSRIKISPRAALKAASYLRELPPESLDAPILISDIPDWARVRDCVSRNTLT